ncbi:hypothetical protein [Microbacterium elymi]|uniref:hypothetical protein n=1 Tax=Microbacterium elymi TaxID=2909587 RepID=UPI00338E0B92
MTTHFYTASSLDGFIATSDHSLRWTARPGHRRARPDALRGVHRGHRSAGDGRVHV